MLYIIIAMESGDQLPGGEGTGLQVTLEAWPLRENCPHPGVRHIYLNDELEFGIWLHEDWCWGEQFL